jgi:hypothetical protein
MAATPTLSQIHAWDTEHLDVAADRWETRAQALADSYDAVYREMPAPGGIRWEGEAADVALLHVGKDRARAVGAADTLHVAAAAARSGAAQISFAKQHALQAIQIAQEQSFQVSENLSVIDRTNQPSTLLRAHRHAQAQAHTAAIRTAATDLAATDQAVATQVTTAAAGLHDVQFLDGPTSSLSDDQVGAGKRNLVQAVDFKQNPPPPAPVPPPPAPPHAPGDPITEMMLPSPPTTAPQPLPVRSFYDQIVQQLAQRPPPDPLVMEALRQAYEANHKGCNAWQWAGRWLGLGGSTAGLIASIPGLVPPVTPVGVAGATAS